MFSYSTAKILCLSYLTSLKSLVLCSLTYWQEAAMFRVAKLAPTALMKNPIQQNQIQIVLVIVISLSSNHIVSSIHK